MPVIDDSKSSSFATTLFPPSQLANATRFSNDVSLKRPTQKCFLQFTILAVTHHVRDAPREDVSFDKPHCTYRTPLPHRCQLRPAARPLPAGCHADNRPR